MTTIRTTVVLAVAGVLAAVTLALAPASTAAGTGTVPAASADTAARSAADPAERRRPYFGSIALDAQGAYGIGNDYRTRGAAIGRALRECRVRSNYPGTCRWAVWVRNNCGAVALRVDANGNLARWKAGFDFRPVRARREAVRKLGVRPHRVIHVCTTRWR